MIKYSLYVPVDNFSVLSNRDEASCTMTQHHAPGDLAIESDALPAELLVPSSSLSVGARLFVQQHVQPVKNNLIEAYTFC